MSPWTSLSLFQTLFVDMFNRVHDALYVYLIARLKARYFLHSFIQMRIKQ